MAELSVSTVPVKDAHDLLKTLRSGRGGRTSRYHPIVEAARALKNGQVVTARGVAKSQVQPLRSYVLKYLDRDAWKVKSAADSEGGTYTVVVGRTSDIG